MPNKRALEDAADDPHEMIDAAVTAFPNDKAFPGAEAFVFDTPPYDTCRLREGDGSIALFRAFGRVEGFCIECDERRVFVRSDKTSTYPNSEEGTQIPDGFHRVEYYCTMNPDHRITLFLHHLKSTGLTKIGQWPSLADIANDEAKIFRKVFERQDQKELSRAIGLAAHGVGIGSFVYMRRVFERLIDRRYKESGLTITDFQTLRMSEKVEALEAHLPEFLVTNSTMYGVLSLGIHQLTEEQCLSYYEVLHESIIAILEDDRRKREDEERRKRLTSAIGQMKNRPGTI